MILKRMKKFAALGLSSLLALSLTACSGNDTSSKTSGKDEKITLDFWTFGSTGYEDLAKEYEKENPNIKIKVKASETADHHDALLPHYLLVAVHLILQC